MGDMKTPDFDDLLAAFDIPDIDANEAIHSGPEENEGPGGSGKPEPSGGGESGEATAAAAGDGPGVSAQASDHGLPPPDISAVSVIVKNTVCPEQLECLAGSSGGEGARAGRMTKEGPVGPRLMQNGFGGPEPSLPGTPHSPAPPSGGTWKEKSMEGKASLDLFAHFGPEPGEHPDPLPPSAPSPPREGAMTPPPFPSPFELARENGPALLSPGSPPPLGALKQDSCSPLRPQGLARPGAGSSPEAMGIPDSTSPSQVAGVPFFKQSPGHQSPLASPKVPGCQSLKEEEDEGPVDKSPPGSPQSPSSGAEAADEDSNDSPASSSSSRPLKVRIKTIKTSCGNITRTVTRVPSDPDPPAPLAEAGFLAEASLLKLSPATPTPEGPKVVSVQLGDGTRLKGTVLPVATIQNASTAMLMAASVARKAVVLPGGTATSPKTMAKNVLGLVPQALPKAEGRAGLGTGGQKVNGASVVMVQPSKSATGPGAGGGTVISRTQSSLVEAFNKILNSKNLLPAYRPNLSPPAEAGLALPPTGYRCLECGDAFSLEKSLARHYDRRSMRIEVTCNHCARRLVFFNKCSLLLHAREHKDKGLVMQCSHLVMRPVALDQMVGQPDITPLLAVPPALGPPALPALGKGDGAVTSSAITAIAAEPPVLPLSTEPPAVPATSAYTCFRCLECKEQCRDKAGMAAHFQQLGPPAAGATSNVCPTCPMMLPSRCSFSAHQRMHKNRPPHVCPECGGNFLQANFQTHLREACLHFSRRVGYRMIYKCAMCDTVFTHKPLLSSHFDQHLLPQRVSVFKCPSCPLLFAQKRTMLEHLKNTHQSGRVAEETAGKGAGGALLTPKTEPEELAVSRGGAAAPTEESSSSSEEEELPSSPSPPRPTKRPRRELGSKGIKGGGGGPGGWTCGLCHSWFPERDEYVAHMKKEHGKSVKKFPCRLCERSFCSAPSLRRHVRVNHEGIKRVYPCRYCTEGKRTFSSRLILEKHVQVRHGLPLGAQSPGRGSALARGPGARAQGPGRKRRQSSDSCSEEPDSTTPPAKSPRGGPGAGGHGALRYRSSGSAEQSLMGLRVDGGAQQCLDCGLCFASPGSLSRHRFISHKKKRGVGSAAALGLGDGEEEAPPPSRSDPEGGDSPLPASGGALTCKVCGKSCDSPLNLKTHFRTHGMAFIRARQGGSGDN
ncbi:zinc finger protein 687 isoform X2 [Camelus dromedarius]|uniref:Zinc finger protein 687 n=2 Tax=Camelus TaxID=9836 RepID=A0A8B8RS55_CAMFR|nr:zinc finger protein 687 isoform X2 [Camelus dromedarius]XP_032320180.1 zinc finger protein 687 isoform X2 [Camelus ferus]XP_045375113.1 zinc finger protein 687 isoform X2 [Camelus bactrianus]